MIRMHGGHHFWSEQLEQKRRPCRLLLEQIGVRRAHGLAAVSRFAAEETRKAMGLGRRRIEVLPNPVDASVFVPRPESVVPGRVVFVGSVVEKKGVRELCQAVEGLVEEFPQLELIIAGRDCRGPSGEPSFRAVLETGLSAGAREVVRFLGPVERREIPRLMASATVCAFPSYMETQGIVIGEAMACGRPVVAMDRGPGPEVLGRDGNCGRLVDPTDPESIRSALRLYLSSQSKAHEHGSAGRHRVEQVLALGALVDRNLDFFSRHTIRW